MKLRRLLGTLGYVTTGLVLGGVVTSACSGSDGGGNTASNFGGSGNGSGSGGGGVGGGAADSGTSGNGGSAAAINLDGGPKDSGINADAACDLQVYEAKLEKKPVDVVFIIDNSCSMSNEITNVENNISTNFAQIIGASGVDYRVIMIAEQGPNSQQSICIGAPLGGSTCPIAANQPPVNNPPLFFHYDNNDVESHDSLCKMIDWYDKPDRYNLAPGGWKDWLRQDALKAFVEVTDDGISCTRGSWSYNDSDNVNTGQTAAQQFDADLLARDPAQFGTAAERNYIWYSIVGLGAKPNPAEPYLPTDAVTTSKCSTAPGPGTGYQWLSNMTGGLKFPVCEGNGFDVVFQEIAKGVIKGATLACEFAMPEPPTGQELDPDTLTIEFTPQGGSKQTFTKVGSAAECKAGAFYVDVDKVKLCPETCTTVQNNDNATLQVLALCKSQGPA